MAAYSTPAWANGNSPAINADNLTNIGYAIELAEHPYGVSSSTASATAKTVTINYSGALSLFTGLTIRVKFTNGNTASSPTLNVNSTGAKAIKSYGTTAATTWVAGQVIEFVYDGTNWLYSGVDAFTKAQSLSSATAAQLNTAYGSTPKTPDEAFALLATNTTDNGIERYVGVHIGTGALTMTLTFTHFRPLLIVIFKDTDGGLTPASGGGWTDSVLFTRFMTKTTINGNTISMWTSDDTTNDYVNFNSSSAASSLNTTNEQYRVIAFGFRR